MIFVLVFEILGASFFNTTTCVHQGIHGACVAVISMHTVDLWFRLSISNYQYQLSIFDFFTHARIMISMFSITFLSLNYIGANLHRWWPWNVSLFDLWKTDLRRRFLNFPDKTRYLHIIEIQLLSVTYLIDFCRYLEISWPSIPLNINLTLHIPSANFV
jgi:hypothetical protein